MKKYVLVGCGNRGSVAFAMPLVRDYGDCAELCGVYDVNYKRAKFISEFVNKEIPVYDDFDEMIKDIKPDVVIITTRDCDHDYYAIRAMKAGCDVIVEKPLTTTFEKALSIKKTEEETGKNVTVTFNLRFHPFYKRVKELLKSGVIGDVFSVHFEWLLNTSHGADYFRRWHSEREKSGSLLVHKSTHHFDLVNWFLEEDPVAVNAFGTRRFYGDVKEAPGKRCLDCPAAKECKYRLDLKRYPIYEKLYLECEDVDNYLRDRCLYDKEVNIEDTISVNVQYLGGTVMSYSLTAHSPYEGMRLMINGSEGRMEIMEDKNHNANYETKDALSLRIFNRKGEVETIAVPMETDEGHGGADKELRDRIFRNENLPDPLNQMADTRAGLMSIGIGMAANISMKENRRVYLSEFYNDIK